MKIEVREGIFWDTEEQIQSKEAIQWLHEEVRPNFSDPTLDEFKRPFERFFDNGTVLVTERQIYLSADYEWARKGVEYIVEQKEVVE